MSVPPSDRTSCSTSLTFPPLCRGPIFCQLSLNLPLLLPFGGLEYYGATLPQAFHMEKNKKRREGVSRGVRWHIETATLQGTPAAAAAAAAPYHIQAA